MNQSTKEPEVARTAPDSIAPAFRAERYEPTQPKVAGATASRSDTGAPASGAPVLIFEHVHRGDRWRVEEVTYDGKTYANIRKWFEQDGKLKATRQGFTMSLTRLPELHDALAAYLGRGCAGTAPDGSAI